MGYTRKQNECGGQSLMARDGYDADGKSNVAVSLGQAGGQSTKDRARRDARWQSRGAQEIETALTKLPATVSGARALHHRERARLNTMLRNAFFAEFGLSVRDVRASGAAGIRDTLERVRRDDRWQSSSFRFIKPSGLGPL